MDLQKKMILEDNMWKVAIKLSWPAVIAMVLYGLNTVFDALFIGRFVGETALAGVSLSYPLTQITLGLGSLVGAGAGAALSIAIGKDDIETQRKLLGNVNFLNIVISAVFTVIGLLFATQLVEMMGASGEELSYGVSYFRMTLYGSFFWIAGLAGNMIVRGEGKMKLAAVMMGSGLIINISANYVLIVLMDLGVEGAAIGTNIGMAVYTFSAFLYFGRKKTSFDAKAFSISRDKEIIKSIMSKGIPSMIMSVMSLLQAIVVLNALTNYGSTADVAFYGIVFRIFTFMLTPIFGLMRALQPVVGINFGAGDYKRVISSFKVFAVVATCLLLPVWIFMMFTPELALNMMLPDRKFIITDIVNFRYFIALLPVLPIIFMAMTFFPSIDKGKIASVLGITRQLVFYVPVMLIMPRMYGVSWVYKGAFIIDFIMIIWCLLLVNKEFKKLRHQKSSSEVPMRSAIESIQ